MRMYNSEGSFAKNCGCPCHIIYKHCSCDCSENGLISEEDIVGHKQLGIKRGFK